MPGKIRITVWKATLPEKLGYVCKKIFFVTWEKLFGNIKSSPENLWSVRLIFFISWKLWICLVMSFFLMKILDLFENILCWFLKNLGLFETFSLFPGDFCSVCKFLQVFLLPEKFVQRTRSLLNILKKTVAPDGNKQ